MEPKGRRLIIGRGVRLWFHQGDSSVINMSAPSPAPAAAARAQTEAEARLAELIVATLRLEMNPNEIVPDEPLFGGGLGLDSIDALELALAVSRAHGIELRSDDERNFRIFASLASLSCHIVSHGASDGAAHGTSPPPESA
jgi:acyl carrier protein